MIRINLLSEGKRPAAVRKARSGSFLESEQAAAVLLVVGLVLAGLLPAAAWWWWTNATIKANDEEIADAQREVDELAAIIAEVDQYKATKAELEHKIAVINDLRNNQRGPVQVMDAISRALPELLWLDRMNLNANSVRLDGRAFNTNAVAAFMDNLDSVPEFQEPVLQDVQERGQVYQFSITFNYTVTPVDEQAETEAATTAAGG